MFVARVKSDRDIHTQEFMLREKKYILKVIATSHIFFSRYNDWPHTCVHSLDKVKVVKLGAINLRFGNYLNGFVSEMQ